jgi:hypothetical protein
MVLSGTALFTVKVTVPVPVPMPFTTLRPAACGALFTEAMVAPFGATTAVVP